MNYHPVITVHRKWHLCYGIKSTPLKLFYNMMLYCKAFIHFYELFSNKLYYRICTLDVVFTTGATLEAKIYLIDRVCCVAESSVFCKVCYRLCFFTLFCYGNKVRHVMFASRVWHPFLGVLWLRFTQEQQLNNN